MRDQVKYLKTAIEKLTGSGEHPEKVVGDVSNPPGQATLAESEEQVGSAVRTPPCALFTFTAGERPSV